MEKYICACCKNWRLVEKINCYEICPICYWENDKIQEINPDYQGGANPKSLNQSRTDYQKSTRGVK